MRKSLSSGALAACALTLISGSLALAGDNWIGTWKLDAAKSKFSPGPGPKAQTLKFESSPEGIRLASEGVAADGKATQAGYTSKFDGNDVPFAGNANADTAQPKKLDDNSYQNIWKKAGKVTITTKGVVSADGKTLTITQSGTDAQGRPVSSTAVYDRQ